MNLYLISRKDSVSWDQYDSAVVAAKDETSARYTHPNGKHIWREKRGGWFKNTWEDHSWVPPEELTVSLIGVATKGVKSGIVCASFNAG